MTKIEVYISTITYYTKDHKRKHLLNSFINPSIDITESFVINSVPTIQKNDIYLIESITIEKQELTT
jgi:hypothetical protein